MTVALTGLLGIQIYWISNAIAVEELRFDSNVNSALQSAVKNINKRETAYVIIKKFTDQDEDVIFLSSDGGKSQSKLIWNTRRKEVFSRYINVTDDSLIEIKIEYEDGSSGDSVKSKIEIITEDENSEHHSRIVHYVTPHIDTVILEQSKLVEEVVHELITFREETFISERLDESELNLLLDEEFSNRGINADYNFGITNNKNEFTVIDSTNNLESLLLSPYKVRLYPDDLMHSRLYLMVSFPDKISYIVKSISSVLGISIILILVIIGLYYKTVKLKNGKS